MGAYEDLQSMGFTSYEARVYLALVANPGVTGYEVSKHSGVPRAKVYEVLEGMVRSGTVLTTEEDRQLYRPLPHRLLLSRHRGQMEEAMSRLEHAFAEIEVEEEEPQLVTLRGYDPVIDMAQRMCDEAIDSILASGFPQDLRRIQEPLARAEQRGIKVYILQFGDEDMGLKNQFFHEISPMQNRQVKQYGRWFAVLRDVKEALMAGVGENSSTSALWTEHMGVVMPLAMWIQHDIGVNVIAEEAGPELSQEMSQKMNNRLAELWQLGLPVDDSARDSAETQHPAQDG